MRSFRTPHSKYLLFVGCHVKTLLTKGSVFTMEDLFSKDTLSEIGVWGRGGSTGGIYLTKPSGFPQKAGLWRFRKYEK